MKILIAGGPRCGKTTLAERLSPITGLRVKHGDDLISRMDWSDSSQFISNWFDQDDDCIIEGVQVGRAIRKWLQRNPKGLPSRQFYYLIHPFLDLNKGQQAMLKGCDTVWKEILPDIINRGGNVSD